MTPAARNVALYPRYTACRHLLFWLPVFFLYFSSLLPLSDVLLLEAIYYAGVVVLEVPSGYFSDRIGRRVTLLIAMAMWTTAAIVFASSTAFAFLAVAQLLQAAGMAFNSGTDTALLYDSLASEERETEVAHHEQTAQSWAFGAMAVAALAGGFAGGLDLRLPYVLTAVAAAWGLAIALRFTEPNRGGATALAPARQLVAVLGRLRDPVLLWVFVYIMGMAVLVHVPYEFYQPYLEFLFGADGTSVGGAGEDGAGYRATPAIAGVLAGVMMFCGAVAARGAVALRQRLGVAWSLLLLMASQVLIIAVMGLWLATWVIGVLVLRSVSTAMLHPIANAAIHPRIDTGMRATYLSVQSLAARLTFSLTLVVASRAVVADGELSYPVLSELVTAFALGGAVLFGVLALCSGFVAGEHRNSETS